MRIFSIVVYVCRCPGICVPGPARLSQNVGAPSVRALPVPDPASSRILTTTARRHATRQIYWDRVKVLRNSSIERDSGISIEKIKESQFQSGIPFITT